MTTEQTTTIVIGSGFSAVTVAAELNRQGIKAIVVDGSCAFKQPTPMQPSTGGISWAELSERSEIVRLLENYARRHALDIRPETRALELIRVRHSAPMNHQWQEQTASGTLSVHGVVFTCSALRQLRGVPRRVGVTAAAHVREATHALGLYLVGVGELALPTTHEILHQAKRAGQSLSARFAACDPGPQQLWSCSSPAGLARTGYLIFLGQASS